MPSIMEFADDFIELFSGNDSFYVENNISIAAIKEAKGKKVKSEAYFKKKAVSEALFNGHLKGGKGLGICPIDSENNCRFGAIDIDHYGGKTKNIVEAIYDNGLPLFPCRSKSGGLHLYFFVKKSVQAKSMVQALEAVVERLGLRQTFGDQHIEIFPKQTKLSDDTQGNCITIPYFKAEAPISYLVSSKMAAVPALDAIGYMKSGRSSIKDLEDALSNMELGDAPPCIQTIITTRALDADSGRNNFLFSCAVFAKKKYGADFPSHVEELNNRLNEPLDKKEVASIIKSVQEHEFNYKCKDIPCRTYCNAAKCSLREFGVGKEKGHFTGLEYGPLSRVMTADPYYQWKLKRMEDDGDFRTLTFKSELDLMDQRSFAKLCMRYINYTPLRIKDNDWYQVLNAALKTVEEVKVEDGTDTSDSAAVKITFSKYLTRKQAGMNKPVQVKMGFVYLDKEAGKYYFTHDGFEKFLDAEKVRSKDSSTLREMLIRFGAKSDVLRYNKPSGDLVELKCWSKDMDHDLEEIEQFYDDVFETDEDIISSTEIASDETDEAEKF